MNHERIFLDCKRVAERYGRHVSTIWRWQQAGTFPAPMRANPNARPLWRLSDLIAWECSSGAGEVRND